MAKISESNGSRDENSGYARLFGNQELGQSLSRMQATVIRSGNELEKLIVDLTPDSLKTEPKSVGITTPVLPGKQVIFNLRVLGSSGERASSADIVFIEHKERRATIIELKDGDTFDTKKASGELDSMQKVASWLSDRLGYNSTIAFCAFNQPNKESIMRGAKGRFNREQVMTGEELCAILGLNYSAIQKLRRADQNAESALLCRKHPKHSRG